MSNIFDQMREAVSQAQATLRAADYSAGAMAGLLRGRLRHVSPWILKDLKRELADFDAHKKEWKP